MYWVRLFVFQGPKDWPCAVLVAGIILTKFLTVKLYDLAIALCLYIDTRAS